MIQEKDAGADMLCLGEDIDESQLWFRKAANGVDLEVSLIGTTDSITVAGWYAEQACQVEEIHTAAGKKLDHTQVDRLVNAMAAFAPPPAGQTTLSEDRQAVLQPVIAAAWQAAA